MERQNHRGDSSSTLVAERAMNSKLEPEDSFSESLTGIATSRTNNEVTTESTGRHPNNLSGFKTNNLKELNMKSTFSSKDSKQIFKDLVEYNRLCMVEHLNKCLIKNGLEPINPYPNRSSITNKTEKTVDMNAPERKVDTISDKKPAMLPTDYDKRIEARCTALVKELKDIITSV